MQRIDRIIQNEQFKTLIQTIEHLEVDRQFCRHGWSHLLDVARIACLISAREGYCFDEEMLYAMALLHDIGRAEQYEQNRQHELAGAKLSEPILRDCGFTEEEIAQITQAIRGHNTSEKKASSLLAKVLYEADKKSRLCFQCPMIEKCKWSQDKKNMTIQY